MRVRSALVATVLAVLALPSAASATVYTVTTTADHADKFCDADCSLRDAVIAAGGPGDSIVVPKGQYTLSAQLGELVLVQDHIVGEGARAVFIDGVHETRLMRVADGSSTVAGVTLRNGNGQADLSPGFGGAVFVQSGGTLTLTNSTVSGNAVAGTAAGGGGIAAAGSLALIGSTVSGNSASAGRQTTGGGILAAGTLLLGNTTITGNTALDLDNGTASRGGGVAASAAFLAQNTTIAGNTASTAGGVFLQAPAAGGGATQTFTNTIVGANAGGACAGTGLATDTTHNNIGADTTCQFTGTADRNSLNPLLGALGNNGGDTDTLALAPTSPAINQGSGCATTDQRGVARPQPTGGVCDIGAYEFRQPTLKVVMAVVNDAGGTRVAGDFTVHVRQGSSEVKGSPAPGLAGGRTYALNPATYVVGADAIAGYTRAIGGDCDGKGAIALVEGQNSTCTITANDIAPKLTVVNAVVNDSGGTAVTSQFSVHVRSGGNEVGGSPQPGSLSGTSYTLTAGNYAVFADGVDGYAATIAGDCAASGAVTLAVGDDKTCRITNDDGAAALAVMTVVVNDDGGTAQADAFTAHVRSGGIEVDGSPSPGAASGTSYVLSAGTYAVSLDPHPGYRLQTSGDCAGDGSITLALGQSKTCTVTADDVAPTLKVVTTVVNDSGGTRTPSGFTVHVRKGAADVSGSPKPGSASGTTYTLSAGTYSVGPDAVAGYTTAVGGACAGGAVTLQPGDAKTCTVSGNDNALVRRQQQLPPPEPGKNVNALPGESGTVRVKLPGTDEFVLLDEDEQIPLGTIVDVRKGRVTIVASDDEAADFYGGIFKLGQTKGAKPITVVTLVEKLSCAKKKPASAAAKKKRKRRLWGDGKGRFRTKGKHSAATVVGTRWLVEDRCTSTLTRVARGRVSVRDFVKKKTVIVRAGKKYVARKAP